LGQIERIGIKRLAFQSGNLRDLLRPVLARYPGLVIPIIDLFAGPGGLSEGFASLPDDAGGRAFRVALSIEMNSDARRTLRLRSFYRQFAPGSAPAAYYEFVRGTISLDELFRVLPKEAKASEREAWQAELGKVDPKEVDRRIAESLGSAADWVLIGGPPCQAYSVVGRSRVRSADPEKFEKDHRHFLYKEYLRILAVHRPPVFVMENVKGILSSTVKGALIVEQILRDLQSPSVEGLADVQHPLQYRLHAFADYSADSAGKQDDRDNSPSDYIIRSERHGIPQARHRFIVLGVRSDIEWKPRKLRNLKKNVSIWHAIRDLPPVRSRLSGTGSSKKENDTPEVWMSRIREIFGEVQLQAENGISVEVRRRLKLSAASLRNVGPGGPFVARPANPAKFRSWFYDSRLGGVCNHESRRHMKQDLWRYLFASSYAAVHKKSPNLYNFPPELLPNHQNLKALESEDEKLSFKDRFRVQAKLKCSTTITSHIAKDGHYFIHYDPKQCRSLTVREAARLQTFPDNYFFTGGKTAQYKQVGNAVPPLLAKKLAAIVLSCFEH
jgi:DNA (cytosine-5)-methyltransferase 1